MTKRKEKKPKTIKRLVRNSEIFFFFFVCLQQLLQQKCIYKQLAEKQKKGQHEFNWLHDFANYTVSTNKAFPEQHIHWILSKFPEWFREKLSVLNKNPILTVQSIYGIQQKSFWRIYNKLEGIQQLWKEENLTSGRNFSVNTTVSK